MKGPSPKEICKASINAIALLIKKFEGNKKQIADELGVTKKALKERMKDLEY